MKQVNENFQVSDDAEYTLISPFELHVQRGNAEAWASGARAVALASGARAVAWASGALTFQKDEFLSLVESDGHMLLMSPDGEYYAGCRGPLLREQALQHWDREDDRACLFTLAIGICTPESAAKDAQKVLPIRKQGAK